MNGKEFSEDIIAAYYDNPQVSASDLAAQFGLNVSEVEEQLHALRGITTAFSSLNDYEMPQMVLNRIAAHAREQAANVPVPFWQRLFNVKWAFSASFVFLLLATGLTTYNFYQDQNLMVASVDEEVTMVESAKERIFKTTLDQYKSSPHFVKPHTSHRPRFNGFSPASPVSVGGSKFETDDLDEKIFNQNLNSDELKSLFYRARKFEKQGYFSEALKDYEFIAKFYPRFAHPQVMHIAMARCLEGLGKEDEALNLLFQSQSQFGKSQELERMVEQLKSQTF